MKHTSTKKLPPSLSSPIIGSASSAGPMASLLPVMTVVLIAFLVIGIALPVLPLHVHHGLGLSTFVVGLITGSQFAASVISRVFAGRFADTHGPKLAVVVGLLLAMLSGLLYLASLLTIPSPWVSGVILLAGRAVLGVAESYMITGAIIWGLALCGATQAGRVIAWMGMAMFTAMAAGAPIGTTLYAAHGFAGVAVATTLLPLGTLAPVAWMSSVPPTRKGRVRLSAVAGSIWLPGVGAALSSIGFGAILAFGALLASERGWSPVWLPFCAFAIALVLTRAILGQLPDTLGGARVALVSVLVEAAGLALIWAASPKELAVFGAALVGAGYALVYPGLGVEAIRRAPPEGRGMVMGAYTVFLDVALGFGTPALGLIAAPGALGATFLASALAAVGAALVAAHFMQNRSVDMAQPAR